jgi:pimeloyl-ACP methyl ester carboxylesterase
VLLGDTTKNRKAGYAQSIPLHSPAMTPLLLLHGVTHSARAWDDVAPLLPEFDLIIPTATGHRGGRPRTQPVTLSGLVDEVEQLLDHRGLGAVHLAGNSMGGWMAIELARRGRALSVCAFSPAGCWTPGAADKTIATEQIRSKVALARRFSAVAPLAMRLGFVRHLGMRIAAEHGERLTARQAIGMLQDLEGCTATEDMLNTTESVAPLDPLPCPITLAWSEHDRLFPPEVNGVTAQQLMPAATYVVLPGVGHCPMIDDPALCAETIRAGIEMAQ